ncbi:hypothetical protein AYO40_01505 [Planctomycetaceae bacterium SCGC AG-212-D15]|nr:hypothetical protein AYO40_01505 [Planctomycetaceae bacterium SCGC AG-212-D15]
MDRELICKWLGLPSESWPPDHYTLLGLSVGEADVRKIEEHVHDRLVRLRQYQLNHPEQVTEAMNRLAQAFSCLTDPKQKKAYDAAMRPATTAAPGEAGRSVRSEPATVRVDPKATMQIPAIAPAAPRSVASPAAEPVAAPTESPDPLAWLFGPWSAPALKPAAPTEAAPAVPAAPAANAGPAVGDWKTEPPPARIAPPPEAPAPPAPPVPPTPPAEATAPVPPAPTPSAPEPASPAPEPANPAEEAARSSPRARRGLGTKRALFRRIVTTRQLLAAWKKIGRYLAHPDRRLTRLAEATDLVQELNEIEELLEDFPRLLGEAGQPGYLVLALAQQPTLVPTFRGLSPSQREALARDWNAALEVLLQHRSFLRGELRCLRKQRLLTRGVRALTTFVSDHALLFAIAAGAMGLLLAAWSFHRYRH